MLIELLMRWTVMLRGSPDSFDSVRGLDCRCVFWHDKAALCFCCQGRGVLLSAVELHSGRAVVVPPLMPTVSLRRNYVRVVLVSPFDGGWGWGCTAMLARNVPAGFVVGYFGLA